MVDTEINKATKEAKTLRQKSEAQVGITPDFVPKLSKKRHSLSLELPKLRPNNSSHKNLAIIHGFGKDLTTGLTAASPSNEGCAITVSPSSNISPPISAEPRTASPETPYASKGLLKLPQLQFNARSLPSTDKQTRRIRTQSNSMIYPSLASKVLQLQHSSSLPSHERSNHSKSRTCSDLEVVTNTRLSRVYSSSKTNSMHDADIHYNQIMLTDDTTGTSTWSPTMKNINESI